MWKIDATLCTRAVAMPGCIVKQRRAATCKPCVNSSPIQEYSSPLIYFIPRKELINCKAVLSKCCSQSAKATKGVSRGIGTQSSIACSISTSVPGSLPYFSCAMHCSANTTLQTLCRWASQHLCEAIKHRNLTLQTGKGRLWAWLSCQAYEDKQFHSNSHSFRALLYFSNCEDYAHLWGLIWSTAISSSQDGLGLSLFVTVGCFGDDTKFKMIDISCSVPVGRKELSLVL